MRMTIVKTQTLFAACVFVCMATLIGLASYTFSELRIGSPSFDRIIAGKDLVADILPPPEYIIEAYLEANMAERFGADPKRIAKLQQLRKDFDERREFWGKADLPSELKLSLTDKAAKPALAFFNELDTVFLPAIQNNDKDAIAKSFARLTTAYNAQRAAVDELVDLSNTFLTDAQNNAEARGAFLQKVALGTTAIILLFLAGAVLFMKRRVANPIAEIADSMATLAKGEDVDVSRFVSRSDEVGAMAEAVAVFAAAAVEKKALEERELETRAQTRNERLAREAEQQTAAKQAQIVIHTLAEGLGRLSEGDLLHQINQQFEGEADQLRNDFNVSLAKLRDVIVSVVQNSEEIRSGSREISLAADDLSRRTDNQAASLEETSAALTEISHTVKRTAEGAAHARDVVAQTKKDADLGGEIAHQAVDAMNGIEQASQQISQIIGVIDEIAFQTNLLALNAGVEAARAGDSGRGFAVVAQEVRALAQRSADAAKEIKSLITNSRNQVETGVKLVIGTGDALKRIVKEVQELSEIVQTISSSASDQANGLQEITAAVTQMDEMTQQNAAMVQQSTAASHQLAAQADVLTQMMGRFTIDRVAQRQQPAPKQRLRA